MSDFPRAGVYQFLETIFPLSQLQFHIFSQIDQDYDGYNDILMRAMVEMIMTMMMDGFCFIALL